jgi:hypothetical protein
MSMNLDAARRVMMPTDRAASLLRRLSVPPGEQVWAVLDGASIPNARQKLVEDEPEYVCLRGNDLKPDLAATAPYLVHIEPPASTVTWVLGEGWGRHWGILALSKAPMAVLEKHFRSLLTAELPGGRTVMFRYYDPRVLSLFLPTCDQGQLDQVFGPVSAFIYEGRGGADVIRAAKGRAPLKPAIAPF